MRVDLPRAPRGAQTHLTSRQHTHLNYVGCLLLCQVVDPIYVGRYPNIKRLHSLWPGTFLLLLFFDLVAAIDVAESNDLMLFLAWHLNDYVSVTQLQGWILRTPHTCILGQVKGLYRWCCLKYAAVLALPCNTPITQIRILILIIIFFMTPRCRIQSFICGRPPQIKYHLSQILFLALLIRSHRAWRGYRVSLDMSPALNASVLFVLSTFYNCLTNFKHVATAPRWPTHAVVLWLRSVQQLTYVLTGLQTASSKQTT